MISRLFFLTIALLIVSPLSFALPMNGQAAPGFSVVDINGGTQDLSSFKGKIVVLEWSNPDCPFVKKHYKSENMQSLQKKYTESGVVWLTLYSSAEGKQGNYSPSELNEKLKSSGAASTAFIKDEKGEIGRLYGARTTPHMFVIDKDGKLAYQGAIDDNDSVNPDDAKNARNYVAAAIDSINKGTPVEVIQTDPYGCSVKYQ